MAGKLVCAGARVAGGVCGTRWPSQSHAPTAAAATIAEAVQARGKRPTGSRRGAGGGNVSDIWLKLNAHLAPCKGQGTLSRRNLSWRE